MNTFIMTYSIQDRKTAVRECVDTNHDVRCRFEGRDFLLETYSAACEAAAAVSIAVTSAAAAMTWITIGQIHPRPQGTGFLRVGGHQIVLSIVFQRWYKITLQNWPKLSSQCWNGNDIGRRGRSRTERLGSDYFAASESPRKEDLVQISLFCIIVVVMSSKIVNSILLFSIIIYTNRCYLSYSPKNHRSFSL